MGLPWTILKYMPEATKRDRVRAETKVIQMYRRAGMVTINRTMSELGKVGVTWWLNSASPEQVASRQRNLQLGRMSVTTEMRRRIGKAVYKRGLAKLTKEQRQENNRKSWLARTLPDGRRVRTLRKPS